MQQPILEPNQRIRVTQEIVSREGTWTTAVEGTVVYCQPRPTGSWFAHGKNDKLWLQRIRLRRDDGELIELSLDDRTRVTVLN